MMNMKITEVIFHNHRCLGTSLEGYKIKILLVFPINACYEYVYLKQKYLAISNNINLHLFY